MKKLTVEQQKNLLTLARLTIKNALEKLPPPSVNAMGKFTDEVFKEKCGAFVTIHKKGKLRGCIGYIVGVKTLPETIIDMAIASAFKDPRFPPLRNDEFNDIDIEISVLTPIQKVEKIDEIEVGRDGLIISNGYRQGLLLPQVATEYGWNREQFLEHTCYKAGLPGDAWKWKDTKIEKFSAQVFGEKELGII
ncbi:MAG: AmmeMemoRadiSam system protein A [Spirochaetes bacterium]|nr:AmmeMemoRadiSam system protein A [Spirochaetota bacterium]